MIATTDVMDELRTEFHLAIRRNANIEWTLTHCETLCELILWNTGEGPLPFVFVGLRVPSPEIGNRLLVTAVMPMSNTSPGDWDQLVGQLAVGLSAIREQVIAKMTTEQN